MNYHSSVYTIFVFSTACLCSITEGGEAKQTLAFNNKKYPSWYWDLLSGEACLVEASVEFEKQLDFRIQISFKTINQTQEEIFVDRVYKGLLLSKVKSIYMPAYFHASDTSILSAIRTNKELFAYIESKARVHPIVEEKQKRENFLIKPLKTPQGTKMEIIQKISGNEITQALELVGKLTVYESDEIGIHMK